MKKEYCKCLDNSNAVDNISKNGDPLTNLLFIAFVAFLLVIGFLLGVILI